MALEIIVRGRLGKDCPHKGNIEELKQHLADEVRRKLELKPEDKVVIEFKEGVETNG